MKATLSGKMIAASMLFAFVGSQGCGNDVIQLPAPDRSYTSFQITLTTTPEAGLVGAVRVTIFQPSPAEDSSAADYDAFAGIGPGVQTDGTMPVRVDKRDVDGNGRPDLVVTVSGDPFNADRSPCQGLTLMHTPWGGPRVHEGYQSVPRFRVGFEVLTSAADGGSGEVVAGSAPMVPRSRPLFALPFGDEPFPLVELSAVCASAFSDRCTPRALEGCQSLGMYELSGIPGALVAP